MRQAATVRKVSVPHDCPHSEMERAWERGSAEQCTVQPCADPLAFIQPETCEQAPAHPRIHEWDGQVLSAYSDLKDESATHRPPLGRNHTEQFTPRRSAAV